MTSSINFIDLSQKMDLLKTLHKEVIVEENLERQERYFELRREVSRILLPLFMDLDSTSMLMFWTKNGGSVDEMTIEAPNSGILMSMKENAELHGSFE